MFDRILTLILNSFTLFIVGFGIPEAFISKIRTGEIYTGCRISEGLNLTRDRVDLRGKAIVFETLKRRSRGHFRSVRIPDGLTGMFARAVAGLPSSECVWKFHGRLDTGSSPT
jgi:hypothetical protein